MLTTYFKRQTTCATYYAGAAGPYLDAFTDWLTQRGFKDDAIRHLLLGAIEFATWLQAANGSLTSLCADTLTCFDDHLAKHQRLRCSKGQHSIYWRGSQYFVEFLCTQQNIIFIKTTQETAQPKLLAAFETWMQVHRGVLPSTLNNYRRHIVELLSTLGDYPERFNATQLHQFILDHARHHGPAVAQTRVKSIRMFLRFLIATERCPLGLDAAIPTIAQWRLSTLPRYLSPDDVERVIAACNGSAAINLRDKAIVLLLARLGLRASEVSDLKFDDIDWSSGTLTLMGKSRREAKVPLPQEVGDALLAYLDGARPSVNSRYVFITVDAPWMRITRYVVKHAATRAIRRAGVATTVFGAHVLRHSAATGLLRQGASLQVIGEVLRHSCVDTTALYAKVDIRLLKQITRPWPGGASC